MTARDRTDASSLHSTLCAMKAAHDATFRKIPRAQILAPKITLSFKISTIEIKEEEMKTTTKKVEATLSDIVSMKASCIEKVC
jgi:hypothetical protein